MQIRHTAPVMLLALLVLASATAPAQQSTAEPVSCPKGRVLKGGKCLEKPGHTGWAGQSVDETKPPAGKDRPKTPRIKECPARQILKDDQCVPMNP